MEPPLTLIDPREGAVSGCYIDDPLGVSALLRAVVASGARAAAYFGGDRGCIHTSLLAVEPRPGHFLFEKAEDLKSNAELLRGGPVTFVTSDAGVPVQFVCQAPALALFGGAEAFRAAMPERVLRLQRRGTYRLPVHGSVRCHIVPAENPSVLIEAWVYDVSCGGLNVGVPPEAAVLARDAAHSCALELAAEGRMETPVEVHSTGAVVLPTGAEGVRYGLAFRHLTAKQSQLLNRYILEQQRGKSRR